MVATTWTTPTDDLLFISGDYTAASDTLKVSGLAHWIPYTAPSASESYYGVDRSVDPDRLAGVRVDATTLPIDEAVYKLASQVADNGGVPDLCFMNYDNHEKLQNIMGSKAGYMDFKVGEVNFAAARINGPAGPIRVIPDRFCSGNRIYCLTQETWALKSLGSVPMILDLDGNKFLRDDAYDSYEVRVAYMGNLYTEAPGYNGVAAVS
jgi:hypothetical protein